MAELILRVGFGFYFLGMMQYPFTHGWMYAPEQWFANCASKPFQGICQTFSNENFNFTEILNE
jgi:hypothetical protein